MWSFLFVGYQCPRGQGCALQQPEEAIRDTSNVNNCDNDGKSKDGLRHSECLRERCQLVVLLDTAQRLTLNSNEVKKATAPGYMCLKRHSTWVSPRAPYALYSRYYPNITAGTSGLNSLL